MKKLVGHGCASESRIPALRRDERDPDAEHDRQPRSDGEPLRGRRGCDHERQDEQDADDLDGLGRRQREQQEDGDRERADRHAARRRNLRVDARELQRPVE